MALLIKTKGKNRFSVFGTDIKVKEVYVRFQILFQPNGRSYQVAPFYFLSKDYYKSNQGVVNVGLPTDHADGVLDEGVAQTIESVHEVMKKAYSEFGDFVIEIDL